MARRVAAVVCTRLDTVLCHSSLHHKRTCASRKLCGSRAQRSKSGMVQCSDFVQGLPSAPRAVCAGERQGRPATIVRRQLLQVDRGACRQADRRADRQTGRQAGKLARHSTCNAQQVHGPLLVRPSPREQQAIRPAGASATPSRHSTEMRAAHVPCHCARRAPSRVGQGHLVPTRPQRLPHASMLL